jgi:hypothetical protein
MPTLDRQDNVFVLDLGDGENRFHPHGRFASAMRRLGSAEQKSLKKSLYAWKISRRIWGSIVSNRAVWKAMVFR